MPQPGDSGSTRASYVIVVGFGVPGRAIAEQLAADGVEYRVVERNPETVARCARGGEHIMVGDATDPDTLRRAGIERATMVAVAVPDEKSGLQITKQARQLNPTAKILTRCHYISAGFQAKAAGANEVIVSEEVVAMAFTHLVAMMLAEPEKTADGG